MKGKGERERHTQLNAEFQRIVRTDKAFLLKQCKETGKQQNGKDYRDLFKKIEDSKGTFHVRMGMINDRNGKDLKQIKKRWQEYTELLYKKGLNDPDNHDDVVTYLDPDILDCEVKWAIGSIITKLTEVTEFQLSYFKS